MNIIYALMVTAGFIPLVIVLYKMSRVSWMKKNGIRTTGILRDIRGHASKQLNKAFIEYKVIETGQVIRKEIMVAGMPYDIGETLPLYYEKNKPGNMLLDGGKSFVILLLFAMLLSVFFIIACFMINKSIATGEI